MCLIPGQSRFISGHTNWARIGTAVKLTVLPGVLGATVDGGLDSRLRGNDRSQGLRRSKRDCPVSHTTMLDMRDKWTQAENVTNPRVGNPRVGDPKGGQERDNGIYEQDFKTCGIQCRAGVRNTAARHARCSKLQNHHAIITISLGKSQTYSLWAEIPYPYNGRTLLEQEKLARRLEFKC